MNEITLTKEIKILLLDILAKRTISLHAAEIIAQPFGIEMTPEQFNRALEMIKPKNIK